MRIFRHLTANDQRLEPFPFRRELSMQAYLIDNEAVLALDDEVFNNVDVVDTELFLKQGQHIKGTDGRIDILATYAQEYIAVVELKLGQLEKAHLVQLESYLLERHQLLAQFPAILSPDSAPHPKWIGVLVGSSIEAALADQLRQGYLTTQGIPVAALTVQRFRGADGSVLVTTDSYFKRPAGKDTTQYVFEGKQLGKGRLVLAIVKRHVDANPTLTFAELEQAFPKSCQGSVGVVATAEQANQIYATSGRKRHYLEAEELIQLQDATVAVSSQWGAGNIDRLLKRAGELGYAVQVAAS
ncbi:MAG: hypothetical protein KGL50_14570 [Burkholderiales bacterium]|nr:hypothetical protein [Burkholderiales bacterium]